MSLTKIMTNFNTSINIMLTKESQRITVLTTRINTTTTKMIGMTRGYSTIEIEKISSISKAEITKTTL